jgi:hypothetical protein
MASCWLDHRGTGGEAGVLLFPIGAFIIVWLQKVK